MPATGLNARAQAARSIRPRDECPPLSSLKMKSLISICCVLCCLSCLAQDRAQGARPSRVQEGTGRERRPSARVQRRTALMRAAERGDAARVRALVRGGADVNASLSSGATALTLAARQGHLGVVKLLLAAGADPRARLFSFHGGDYTALMAPIGIESEERVEIVDALIEAGAEINPASGFGRSPLMYAVERRDLPSLKLLISRGAKVNSKNTVGLTPLLVAVLSRSTPDILQCLIDVGADVNARSADGMTALSIAEQQRREDTIRLLREAGARH